MFFEAKIEESEKASSTYIWAPPLLELLHCSALNAVTHKKKRNEIIFNFHPGQPHRKPRSIDIDVGVQLAADQVMRLLIH